MKLVLPETATFDPKRKCSTLIFPKESIAPTGEYSLKGGVCWPTMTDDDGIRGAMQIVGEHIESKICYVFEGLEFMTIDHIVEDGRVLYQGASSWLNGIWRDYYCRDYYWNQEYETNRKFLLQTARSPMIMPKPQFVEVHWQDPAQAIHSVFERDATGKLVYRRESKLHEAVEEYNADHDVILPPLHALMCCLVGIDAYPWRERS